MHEVSGQGAVVRGRGQEVDLGTHVVAARLTELTHPARDVWVHGHTVPCQGGEERNDKKVVYMPSRKRMRSLIDATINLPIQCSVVIHQKVVFFKQNINIRSKHSGLSQDILE